MIKLKCEICGHEVCTVDTDKLKLPLTGAMFGPPEEWMPNPFDPSVDWTWMRCPMCRYRPFIEEGHFTTADDSWLRVNKNGKIDRPIVDKPMGDQFGDVAEGSEESEAIDAAWSEVAGFRQPKKELPYRDLYDGEVKVREQAAVEHECGETGLSLMEGEPEPVKVVDPSQTNVITVEDEVMRLHGKGMRPGQISRELAKSGHKIHHLQVAKKIKARLAA